MGNILYWDKSLFLWLNNNLAHPLLDPFFYLIGWLGNGWVLMISTAIFFLAYKPDYLKRQFPWILLSFCLSGICVILIKDWVNRPRPLLEFASLIKANKVYIHTVGPHLKVHSFPSGHTQTAFCVATYLSLLFKRLSPIFLGLACLVAISRIYAGVHYPLDVVAGAVIGGVFSYIIWLWRKKTTNIDTDEAN